MRPHCMHVHVYVRKSAALPCDVSRWSGWRTPQCLHVMSRYQAAGSQIAKGIGGTGANLLRATNGQYVSL